MYPVHNQEIYNVIASALSSVAPAKEEAKQSPYKFSPSIY